MRIVTKSEDQARQEKWDALTKTAGDLTKLLGRCFHALRDTQTFIDGIKEFTPYPDCKIQVNDLQAEIKALLVREP